MNDVTEQIIETAPRHEPQSTRKAETTEAVLGTQAEITVDYTSVPKPFNWEAAGVISTFVLSAILIACTIRLALRQNALQTQIADRDVRAQNYQHRVKCYLQIVDAFNLIKDTNIMNVICLLEYKNTVAERLKDMAYGSNLMIKSYTEAKLLFSPKLIELVKELHDSYIECCRNYYILLTQNTSWIEKLKELKEKIHSNAELLAAIANPANINGIESLMSEIPELKALQELDRSLYQKYQSSELHELFRKETQV